MAQPPLTQQIQKLERELGYQVFVRQPRKTTLTDAGLVLLEEARRILAGMEQAIDLRGEPDAAKPASLPWARRRL